MREYLNKTLSIALDEASWNVIKKMVNQDVYKRITYSRIPTIIRNYVYLAVQGEVSKFNALPL